MNPRRYQTALIYEVSKLYANGKKRVVMQLPTGGGKTMIAKELVTRTNAAKILWIVPSEEILLQTGAALDRARVRHATLAAGRQIALAGVSCLLAMSQTLARRLGSSMFDLWEPELIIVDEAHKLIEQHRKVLERWPCPVIGFSATPVRLDGKPLAKLWPVLLCGPSIASLQRQKYLVPCRTINAPMPDLSMVKKVRGDFDAGQLDAAYCGDNVAEQAALWWKKCAKGKRTIAFTPGITSSMRFSAAYKAIGIRCEHVDGDTPKTQRAAALDRLRRHQIDVLFNCALFIEGLDLIEVECVQLLTSTMSLSRFMQQCGRGLRPAPGKRELIVLDHGGNTERHDRVDADRDWYHGGVSTEAPKKTCLACGAIIAAGANPCPACFRPPAPVAPHSPLQEARSDRATSKRTPPRPVPVWAKSVADQWRACEHRRYADALPLSEPERYCRRILRRALLG